MSLELNDKVQVTLTFAGALELNTTATRINNKYPLVRLRANYKKEDKYIATLWALFRTFGPTLESGPLPFTNIEKVE